MCCLPRVLKSGGRGSGEIETTAVLIIIIFIIITEENVPLLIPWENGHENKLAPPRPCAQESKHWQSTASRPSSPEPHQAGSPGWAPPLCPPPPLLRMHLVHSTPAEGRAGSPWNPCSHLLTGRKPAKLCVAEPHEGRWEDSCFHCSGDFCYQTLSHRAGLESRLPHGLTV